MRCSRIRGCRASSASSSARAAGRLTRRDRPAPSAPVTGGATRRQVGARRARGDRCRGGAERVLIHDAARPFLPAAVIDRLLAALATMTGRGAGAAGGRYAGARWQPAGRRRAARRARTASRRPRPSASTRSSPRTALGQAEKPRPTTRRSPRDAGYPVALVDRRRDAREAHLRRPISPPPRRATPPRLRVRTGMGFDVHAFARGRAIVARRRARCRTSQACRAIATPMSRSMRITDALLGAIGDGDIGIHFPPSDPQWRGARFRPLPRACRRADRGRGRRDRLMSTSPSSARRRRSARTATRCARASPRCCGCPPAEDQRQGDHDRAAGLYRPRRGHGGAGDRHDPVASFRQNGPCSDVSQMTVTRCSRRTGRRRAQGDRGQSRRRPTHRGRRKLHRRPGLPPR